MAQAAIANTSALLSSDGSASNTTIIAPEILHGVPSNPTGVTAVAFDGSAEVTWKHPDDDGFDPILEYEVAWFDEESNTLVGTQIVSDTMENAPTQSSIRPSISIIVPNLQNGRSYAFKVRAKNTNGFSVWSAKSLPVSPLQPPDLCARVACSGHGLCFPNYDADAPMDRRRRGRALEESSAQCICQPGYLPPDCSVRSEAVAYVWTVSEWGDCSSGCSGGTMARDVHCFNVTAGARAPSSLLCEDKKPSATRICNSMECGSKLVSIRYKVEMSFDEVIFSAESRDAFEFAFTSELAAALQIPRSRMEVTAIKRGSIIVLLQILPASRAGEKSLNDVVDALQMELDNATSTLRSKGTFARRVEPTGVTVSFSLSDQTVAGGAEDISLGGLIGTVMVLCFFVSTFAWFLRRRYNRIMRRTLHGEEPEAMLDAQCSDMKRMRIETAS